MERLQEVIPEAILKIGSKTEFKWNQRLELTEDLIYGLDVWYEHRHMFIFKGL